MCAHCIYSLSRTDDLVKASRKTNPKKTPVKKGLKKTGAPKTPQSGGKIKTPKTQNSDQKIAKKVGFNNAKRAALTNQVRFSVYPTI